MMFHQLAVSKMRYLHDSQAALDQALRFIFENGDDVAKITGVESPEIHFSNTGDPNLSFAEINVPNTDILPAIAASTKLVCSAFREALDYAGYACRKPSRGETNQTHFPFSKFKRDFKSTEVRGSRDIIPEIYRVMAWFRPYGDEDGDIWLAALNEIRNANGHKFIQPSVPSVESMEVKFTIYNRDLEQTRLLYGDQPIFQPSTIMPHYDSDTNRIRVGVLDRRFTSCAVKRISITPSIIVKDKLTGNVTAALMFMYQKIHEILTAIEIEDERIGVFSNSYIEKTND